MLGTQANKSELPVFQYEIKPRGNALLDGVSICLDTLTLHGFLTFFCETSKPENQIQLPDRNVETVIQHIDYCKADGTQWDSTAQRKLWPDTLREDSAGHQARFSHIHEQGHPVFKQDKSHYHLLSAAEPLTPEWLTCLLKQIEALQENRFDRFQWLTTTDPRYAAFFEQRLKELGCRNIQAYKKATMDVQPDLIPAKEIPKIIAAYTEFYSRYNQTMQSEFQAREPILKKDHLSTLKLQKQEEQKREFEATLQSFQEVCVTVASSGITSFLTAASLGFLSELLTHYTALSSAQVSRIIQDTHIALLTSGCSESQLLIWTASALVQYGITRRNNDGSSNALWDAVAGSAATHAGLSAASSGTLTSLLSNTFFGGVTGGVSYCTSRLGSDGSRGLFGYINRFFQHSEDLSSQTSLNIREPNISSFSVGRS